MKLSILTFALAIAIAAAARAQQATVNVPGTSNPYLSGMTNGATADGDIAPEESPVLVPLPVFSGEVFTFSASGTVANDTYDNLCDPDGGCDGFPIAGRPGATNGIANIIAPLNCLLGVFLDTNLPSQFSPPSELVFSNADQQNFLVLQPALRQPFFIGEGVTTNNVIQQFIAPPGATRLFLATMDGIDWNNNPGSFTVIVSAPPIITSFGVNGPTLTLSATNGQPDSACALLESTNLAAPAGQWTPLLTNNFNTNGVLNLSTNVIAHTNAQMFYLLQEP